MAFRPQVTYTKRGERKSFRVKTYAEVKRQMKTYLAESDGEVCVSRSRRAEWGEWFERWEMGETKPIIVKQTWL